MAGLLYIWQTCSDLISAVRVSDHLVGVVHVVILKQLPSFFFFNLLTLIFCSFPSDVYRSVHAGMNVKLYVCVCRF